MSPLRRWLVLALLLLMGVPSIVSLLTTRSGASATVPITVRRVPGPRSIQSLDTVIVFPVTKYQGYSTSSWLIYDNDAFNADTVAGRRYLVEIVNGSPSVTGLIFIVNGQQFVGSSEMSTVARRIIDVQPGSNSMEVWVKGSSSSYVYLRVTRVNDPTFSVFPAPPWPDPAPKTYVRPTPIAAQNDTFLWTTGDNVADLRIINGYPDGSHRINNATLSINGSTVLNSWDWSTGKATINTQVTLNTTSGGSNNLSLTNSSASGTQASIKLRIRDTTAPVFTWTAPADSFATASSSVTVQGTVTDEIAGTVKVNSQAPHAAPGSFTDAVSLSSDGKYTLTVTALNSASLQTITSRTVIHDTRSPTLAFTTPAANASVTTDSILFSGTWYDSSRTTATVDGDTVVNTAPHYIGVPGLFSYKVGLDMGSNRILVRAVDAAGNQTDSLRLVFRNASSDSTPGTLSPPALSTTGVTPFLSSVAFLYTGSSPSQVSVDASKLDSATVSVVRGRVIGRDMGPIANVGVQVLGHSEFGRTVSRTDGEYDLVLNGGGQQTLRFTKAGYLEVQRQVIPPPNDFLSLDDVAMLGGSSRKTMIDSGAVFVARSRFASDANGDRDLRVVFPHGTVATVTTAGGTSHAFTTAHVRSKEYTVGGDGPKAMPGALPASSAYTYCVNLRLDEADSMTTAGALASSTQFSTYVGCYTKNFLHLPIGSVIPVGYYDEAVGQWKASDDGYVVRLLAGASGSNADSIDSQGSGHGDSSTRLAALHVTSDELTALKSQYSIGDTLVRFSANHFTTYDPNPGVSQFLNALSSAYGQAAMPQGLMSCPLPPSTRVGSVIECENRVLGEAIPIVGSPYTLNYRSFRASGDSAVRTLRVPVIGASVPDSLQQIIVRLDIAGQVLTKVLNKTIAANSVVSITWNGLDAFGRVVPNSVNAKLAIGYVYNLKYVAGSSGQSFGDAGAAGGGLGAATGDRKIGRTIWSRQTISLGAASTGSDGLGGWTISPHHFFDTTGQGAVFLGDGSVMLGGQLPLTLSTYFGDGYCDHLSSPEGNVSNPVYPSVYPGVILSAPDGSLYIADACRGAVLHVDRAGVIHRIAGTSSPTDYNGDTTTAATSVPLNSITGLALAPDGTLYMSLNGLSITSRVVLKLEADGKLHKIIGGNASYPVGSGGDGGPASSAWIGFPVGLALGPDGSLFISDDYSPTGGAHVLRVRRISPSGMISGYAGWEKVGSPGNDSTGVATKISLMGNGLNVPLATDQDGNLYIVETANTKVRKVSPDGIISTFVQGSSLIDIGSGVARKPYGIAFGSDGACYIAGYGLETEFGIGNIWRRDPTGAVSVVVGGPISFSPRGDGSDGSLAAGAKVTPTTIAVTPNGSIWFDDGRAVVRASRTLGTTSGTETFVPSADGSEVYYFDALSGRHLRTRDALTGAVRYSFRYDGAGRLITIKDLTGDSTIVQRNSGGDAIGIVGPFGHRTKLTPSSSDLASVTDTLGESYQMTYYSGGGLLHTFTDPNNNVHTFAYAADGRLSSDQDPNPPGGTQTVSTPTYSGTTRTVAIASGEGHITNYAVSDQYSGSRQQSVTEPSGQVTTLNDSTNAKLYGSFPDGMTSVTSFGRDPRTGFGMIAPIAARDSVVLPVSGNKRVVVTTRTIDPGFAMPQPQGKLYNDVVINGRNPFHTEFDATHLTLTTTTPEGRRTTTTVDSAGRPLTISVLGIANDIHMAYDVHGRDSLFQQGNEGWRYGYDGKGRLATIRDTLGRRKALLYDGADRITRQVLPDSIVVAYHYDPNGNLDSLTTPTLNKHQFAFNGVNQPAAYIPPNVGSGTTTTSYSYNRDRELTQTLRPDGATVVASFDAYGRLGAVTIPRGGMGISYKTSGQVDTVGSPDAVRLTYSYDGSLTTQEVWSGRISGTVGTTADADFRAVAQTINGADTVRFRYDGDGLLVGAGVDSLRRSPSSGLLDSTWLSGLAATNRQDYNGNGELQNLHYGWSGGGSFLESYARDALGRITSRYEAISGDTARTFGYVYWNSGRLKEVTRSGKILQHCEYDANGNRRLSLGASLTDSASDTYDAQDRLLRHGNATYSYSKNGELTMRVTGTDTTAYTYDELGNLITVILPSKDRIDYLIDGRNRRVGRKVNGHQLRGWLYEAQLTPVAEFDSTGAIVARYVYGSRDNVPDYMVKGGKTYRVVTDHLGSVRMVVRADTALVAERIDYDAWGRVINDTNAGFQAFAFAGGLYDQETRLTRFGARDYDASVGRWTCKDPAGIAYESSNLYPYVGSDPMNYTDPSGLFWWYGNWGGPHWTNGTDKWGEGENFPRMPGQLGFKAPIDARDECYMQHDVCLRDCARLTSAAARQECRADCDLQLSNCLAGLHNECIAFKIEAILEQIVFGAGTPNDTPTPYHP